VYLALILLGVAPAAVSSLFSFVCSKFCGFLLFFVPYFSCSCFVFFYSVDLYTCCHGCCNLGFIILINFYRFIQKKKKMYLALT
jgi:hypothetical protein